MAPTAGDSSILVVEDEATLRELLSASLRFAGFTVAAVPTGGEALRRVAGNPPDLMVLDVMLPDIDGFEVLRRLRAAGPASGGRRAGRARYLPVLFLTARGDTEDKVSGLTAGGDDYLTKPFKLEELIARIRAILRRTGGPGRDSGLDDSVLAFADLELDPHAHRVTRAGHPVQLSPTEFRLLHCLLAHADHPLPKAQILDEVWRYDFDGDESIVETYISYLRRKVDRGEPKLIHTVRGVGYVLRNPEQ